jgi:chromosome segregation ATPase
MRASSPCRSVSFSAHTVDNLRPRPAMAALVATGSWCDAVIHRLHIHVGNQTLDSPKRATGKAATMSPKVIPFARSAQGGRDDNAQLDKAGQTILQLLNKAANVAEQNRRHAIDTAQRLSHQLRAAQDRIAELEAEVEAYRQQAERAEQWLHKVYTEIEDRFLRQDPHRSARR